MALTMNTQRKPYIQVIVQLMKTIGISTAEDFTSNVKRVVWIERVNSQNIRALEVQIDEEYAGRDFI